MIITWRALMICVALSPFFTGPADAEPHKPQLGLEIGFDKNQPFVEVVNRSDQPVSLITEVQLAISDNAFKGSYAIVFQVPAPAKSKGRVIVPSEADLHIVKLLPGEVARLRVKKSAGTAQDWSFPKPATVLKGKRVSISIEYEVPEFWGGRFNVWQGKAIERQEVVGVWNGDLDIAN